MLLAAQAAAAANGSGAVHSATATLEAAPALETTE